MIPTEKIETTRIDGTNIVLMPYTAALVPIYHGWMQNPEMLALTASEPLTLEEEYANQISWNADPTKYCWIIHSRRPVIKSFQDGPGFQTPFGIDYTIKDAAEAKELMQPVNIPDIGEEEEKSEDSTEQSSPRAADGDQIETDRRPSPSPSSPAGPTVSPSSSSPPTQSSDSVIASSTSQPQPPLPTDRYPLTPIGDVNLFLYDDFNLEEYGIAGGGCEIEVMIAEPSYRRRGLGLEAIRLVMAFSAEQLGVERFVVKISTSNTPSIDLFEKKLGFRVVEYVECFDEVVLFKDTSILEPIPPENEEEDKEGTEVESSINGTYSVTSTISQLHINETVTREEESS